MNNETIFFKPVFLNLYTIAPMNPALVIHSRHQGIYLPMTSTITESEFDGYIDYLIKELEGIRQEGKRKFLAAKRKSQP